MVTWTAFAILAMFTNHEHSPALLPLEGERRIRSRGNLVHGTHLALSEAEQDFVTHP